MRFLRTSIRLMRLMPFWQWPRLWLHLIACGVYRVTGIQIFEGMVLPFRKLRAYARTRGNNGFSFLLEILEEGEYDAFAIGPDSGATTLLDIGANAGFCSIPKCLENPALKAFAFEPHPDTFSILVKNIAANRLTGRIIPIQAGVSETPGELEFFTDDHQSMAYADRSMAPEGATVRTFRVPIVPADAFCHEKAIHPEALKIDVEGHEVPVLRGASQTLLRANQLVMEVHSDDLRCQCEELLATAGFHRRDYRPSSQPGRGLLFCRKD